MCLWDIKDLLAFCSSWERYAQNITVTIGLLIDCQHNMHKEGKAREGNRKCSTTSWLFALISPIALPTPSNSNQDFWQSRLPDPSFISLICFCGLRFGSWKSPIDAAVSIFLLHLWKCCKKGLNSSMGAKARKARRLDRDSYLSLGQCSLLK